MSIQWLNGRLIDEADPALGELADTRNTVGFSCITTARVTAGSALHLERHVHRLIRDTRAMGLGSVDQGLVIDAFTRLGRAVFGAGSGIVRIEAQPNPAGESAILHATARPLGKEARCWTARSAPMVHHGPQQFPGAKLARCKLYDDARAFANRSGVDEALLFDSAGRLVEGAHTNVLIARVDGTLSTPDVALGAVAGIALEIIKELVPELVTEAIYAADLDATSEIIAVNAVRGARPLALLDDQKIGGGGVGPWAERLDAMLSATPKSLGR